jgi:hypothetical protein
MRKTTAKQPTEQPLLLSGKRYLPLMLIGLWSLFLTGFPSDPKTTDQLERARWLLGGQPTLRLKLEEDGHTRRPKKYEVSVRFNGGDPYLEMFALPSEPSSTLVFAAPQPLLKPMLKLEVKVAGLNEEGCIISGGAKHVERQEPGTPFSLEEEIRVAMHTLPTALCMK